MKNSNDRQIRNGLIYLLPPVLSATIPIITIPLLTSVLSPNDFGAYALAQAYGLFIMGLVNMGLTTAYERNFFEYRESKKKEAELLYGILGCILLIFSIAMIGTWMARYRLAFLIIGDKKFASLLFYSTLSTSVMSFKQYFLLYFRNTEDAPSYARYSMDEMVLNTVLTLFLVLSLKVGVIGMALGQLLGSIFVLSVLCFRFVRRLAPYFSWIPVRDSLSLALPLTPLSLLKVVGTQTDKYMLGLLGNLGGVGVYSIGQRFGYLVFIWTTALQNVFSPQVYHRMFSMSQEDGAKSIGIYMTPFIYLSIGGALGMALFAEEAINILTPSDYRGAGNVAIVLALSYSTLFFAKMPQLTYARKTHISAVISVGSTIITFVSCVFGIRLWGMMGAAWGLLTAGVVTNAVVFLIGQRYYYIHWEKDRISLIYGYLFGASFFVIYLQSIEVGLLKLISVKVLLLFGYLGVGRLVGFFSRDNMLSTLRVITLKK